MRIVVLLAGLAVWIGAFVFASRFQEQNPSLGLETSVSASAPLTEQQLQVIAHSEAQRFFRQRILERGRILRDLEQRYPLLSTELRVRLADLVLAEFARTYAKIQPVSAQASRP
jgi:hypothetical protein